MAKSEEIPTEDIVREIGEVRQDMARLATRLQSLSKNLYDRVRRAESDDNTTPYVNYSTAWARFATMVSQGLDKTKSADKLLVMVAANKREAEEKRERDKIREKSRERKKEAAGELSPIEKLLALYGPGERNH